VDVPTAFLLIGVGVFVVATLLGTLTEIPYAWIGAVGVVLGLGLWAAAAIALFRGPDNNRDLGEEGWTIAVGILLAFYVVVWLLGAAVGRGFRGRAARSRSASV
jgi:predicted Kef-type K+ transport protein